MFKLKDKLTAEVIERDDWVHYGTQDVDGEYKVIYYAVSHGVSWDVLFQLLNDKDLVQLDVGSAEWSCCSMTRINDCGAMSEPCSFRKASKDGGDSTGS